MIPVGCQDRPSSNDIDKHAYIMPAACVVFGQVDDFIGKNMSKVPKAYSSVEYLATPANTRVIGVSIDGIIDPEAARDHPDAAGRHAVLVGGCNVTVTAMCADTYDGALRPAKMLETLWVNKIKMTDKKAKLAARKAEYTMPWFTDDSAVVAANTPADWHKLGTVFRSDEHSAEVLLALVA